MKNITHLRKCLGDCKCVYCDIKWSEFLSIGNTFVSNMQVSHPQHYKTLIEMLDGEHPLCHSWVCGECCCVIKDELSLSSLLYDKGNSNDSILQCRNVVKEMISVLSNDEILLNTEYKQIYRAKMLNLGIGVETADKLVVNFRKFVDSLLTTKYDFISFSKPTKYDFIFFSKPPKPGVVYYNSSLVNSASINLLHF